MVRFLIKTGDRNVNGKVLFLVSQTAFVVTQIELS